MHASCKGGEDWLLVLGDHGSGILRVAVETCFSQACSSRNARSSTPSIHYNDVISIALVSITLEHVECNLGETPLTKIKFKNQIGSVE